jgi:hypothetical protein
LVNAYYWKEGIDVSTKMLTEFRMGENFHHTGKL